MIGNAAGVAFAATGAAAVFSRWQQRRLLQDLGEVYATELNILADDVSKLVRSLLSVLSDVVPLVRIATVDDLTIMVEPPTVPGAAQLVLGVCLHGSSTLEELVGEEQSAGLVLRRRQDVLEALEMAGDGLSKLDAREREWLTAQIVAPALCWYEENAETKHGFLQSAAMTWPAVPELTTKIVTSARELSVQPVPGMRELALSAERLQAVVKTKWQATTLRQVEGGQTPCAMRSSSAGTFWPKRSTWPGS